MKASALILHGCCCCAVLSSLTAGLCTVSILTTALYAQCHFAQEDEFRKPNERSQEGRKERRRREETRKDKVVFGEHGVMGVSDTSRNECGFRRLAELERTLYLPTNGNQ